MEGQILSERVLAELWLAMAHVYGSRWEREYGPVGGATFNAWCKMLPLNGVSDMGIARAIRTCLETRLSSREGAFLPSMADIARLAQPDPADFGLPDVWSAYREALRAVRSWADHRWSHRIVRLAATEVGTFDLRSLSERQSYARFEAAYKPLVARVMRGERVEEPSARIEPKARQTKDPQTNRRARHNSMEQILDILPGLTRAVKRREETESSEDTQPMFGNGPVL